MVMGGKLTLSFPAPLQINILSYFCLDVNINVSNFCLKTLILINITKKAFDFSRIACIMALNAD
jgi:hypothetical protein